MIFLMIYYFNVNYRKLYVNSSKQKHKKQLSFSLLRILFWLSMLCHCEQAPMSLHNHPQPYG